MVTIVDYGMGNLGSIRNMLSRIGAESKITSDPTDVRTAEKLILPGVGAFDRAMLNLEERDLVGPLNERDGTMAGYALGLVRAVSDAVTVPVVACGGAGGVEDLGRAVREGGASAVSAGCLFVFHGNHRAVLVSTLIHPEKGHRFGVKNY